MKGWLWLIVFFPQSINEVISVYLNLKQKSFFPYQIEIIMIVQSNLKIGENISIIYYPVVGGWEKMSSFSEHVNI